MVINSAQLTAGSCTNPGSATHVLDRERAARALNVGRCHALFLLYTLGALAQTWTQYLGAVGAAIAAVFKLINVIRRGGTAGAEAS